MILGQLCQEAMKLEYITRIIQPLTVTGPAHCEIEGIAYDSRQVRPGWLFVALHGRHKEGAECIADAIQRGAVAVVSEQNDWKRRDVTHIRVANARQALAEIAAAFYDAPARKLQVVGITGTNGKSTTAFMLRDIFAADGRRPGLVGTIRYEIGARVIPAARTTPEAPDLQSMLDQMVRAGCRSAVMEVSSHGLVQQRVWGIDFDAAVFTNLTRDHLDYHESMERYFDAKSLLFRGLGQMEKKAAAIINMDDPWGLRLAATNGFRAEVVTYGFHPNARVRAEALELTPEGSRFMLATPWGARAVSLGLLGRFNVSNALAAAAAAGALGVPLPVIADVLGTLAPVPGRLEKIPNARGLLVFVDYAHTDDALANVLQTLREITRRRLIVVFGCGGNRDRAKRPLMGAIAARLADYAIVTSDNPRGEDPVEIITQVAAGFGFAHNFEMEVDREQAIARALALAEPGDTVLIAGKGHENYQEFAHTVVPFDDREVAARRLKPSSATAAGTHT